MKLASRLHFKEIRNVTLLFNYEKLSDVPILSSYILTQVKECIEIFEETQVLLKLDAKSGCWYIKVDKSD